MPEEFYQDQSLDANWLAEIVERTLTEDLGPNPGRDVTTQSTIGEDAEVAGEIVAREGGVVAGIPVIAEVLRQVAERYGLQVPSVKFMKADGDAVAANDVVAQIAGLGHVVLSAERTILNLMSHASGVASHTRRWADALEGTGARVLDTRKTTPTLRELEKYAVRCGGGVNKRMGLYDVAMIKDNHVVATGSVGKAIAAVWARFPDVEVQVEVETFAQAQEALAAGARFLMLDNMSNEQMAEVVGVVRADEALTGKVYIEATGGLTVERARSVAQTGVDFMSVGALTHSSPGLDLALDLR